MSNCDIDNYVGIWGCMHFILYIQLCNREIDVELENRLIELRNQQSCLNLLRFAMSVQDIHI